MKLLTFKPFAIQNMMKFLTLVVIFVTLTSCGTKTIDYEIDTELGSIFIELYPQKAPQTVANFSSYVSRGLYNGSSFFRVCTTENEAERAVQIEVIQGGDIPDDKLQPAIAIETTEETGLKHLNGTISMARDNPNSAQSSFFICINDQPELDFNGKRNPDGQGFAAFGKVTKGMDVVLKIQSLKNIEQSLTTPVIINSIKIIE